MPGLYASLDGGRRPHPSPLLNAGDNLAGRNCVICSNWCATPAAEALTKSALCGLMQHGQLIGHGAPNGKGETIVKPQDRVNEFRDRGFVVERNFFSKEEVSTVLAEIERCDLVDRRANAEASGDIIFVVESYRRSEVIRRFLSQQRLLDFLCPIAGDDLWIRWDQAVTKQPGAGVFHWHQDNAFNKLRTEHFQLWVALTESHQQNGGLWLAPGSHKRGTLPHDRMKGQRIVRSEVGESVCIDASAGDLVLFSSLMLHRTGPNNASNPRTAYVAEYMPLADYDYAAKGPFFIASRKGLSDPKFVVNQEGATDMNLRKYWRERAVRKMAEPIRELRNTIDGFGK